MFGGSLLVCNGGHPVVLAFPRMAVPQWAHRSMWRRARSTREAARCWAQQTTHYFTRISYFERIRSCFWFKLCTLIYHNVCMAEFDLFNSDVLVQSYFVCVAVASRPTSTMPTPAPIHGPDFRTLHSKQCPYSTKQDRHS